MTLARHGRWWETRCPVCTYPLAECVCPGAEVIRVAVRDGRQQTFVEPPPWWGPMFRWKRLHDLAVGLPQTVETR